MMEALQDRLGPGSIVTAPEAMARYLVDWRGRYRGIAQAVLKPRDTAEVAAVMEWATATRTPVVPQGGNTGLSGGATPDASGRAVVLSLERMNRIRAIDTEGDTVVAEAGCVLATVQQASRAAGRLLAISLGSEGSCQIGGIVATNAGGINVIRHGMTRDLVLGLEYVLADGTVSRTPSLLRKDNTGYDLRHLLIGSEGTLAVITAASLRLLPAPRGTATALCGVGHPRDALALLGRLRDAGLAAIASFELMCEGEMQLVLDLLPAARTGLANRHRWYVFVETEGDSDEAARESLGAGMAAALENGTVADAVLAQNGRQAAAIWHLRFAVSEANRRTGPGFSYDVSVATAAVPAFLDSIEAELAVALPTARRLFVGHLGDGNMHVNVVPDPVHQEQAGGIEALRPLVDEIVYGTVTADAGSISAEHGIGRLKVAALGKARPAHELALMRAIKASFDPLGILNPGVVLAAT
ncbi:FAD-binding oxidoreductase [Bosea sp. NBC_00550]|uniref:FAD-binding oxidoreductase n=1 Tax=Bosea sp. NBC_00550 TaxID=2969621 RepID=UPI00222E115E|nr:FAD-binding oxidoreductase [Bosea sp. NBC_00550]UZF93606.1 FAD-binding oxidoreductase [Bosea sp. NBC_00550]